MAKGAAMRILLAVMLAFLPLVQAQDPQLLKSVEPQYEKFSPDLAANFEAATASVTLTVMATGEPLALFSASVPLPMAVVMALKDYEFRPQSEVPHGRPDAQAGTYQVTLNVPIRHANGTAQSAIRINPGLAKGLLIKQVRPEYPEFARSNHIRGVIALEALIGKEGYIESLTSSLGPFELIVAAYEAVRQWQYRPYLLNRQPVEVLTTIEVVFN